MLTILFATLIAFANSTCNIYTHDAYGTYFYKDIDITIDQEGLTPDININRYAIQQIGVATSTSRTPSGIKVILTICYRDRPFKVFKDEL